MTKFEIFILVAIGFGLFLAFGLSFAEPLQLSPQGCRYYTQDAEAAIALRDLGVSETIAQEVYARKKYMPAVKEHVPSLVSKVYASRLERDELVEMLLKECMENDGWIGKGSDT